MKHILIIGAGLIGNAVARDLLLDSDLSLTIVDIDAKRLAKLPTSPRIELYHGDITDDILLASALKQGSMIVNAVPGHLGFKVLKELISRGHDVVDISFAPEDPFDLDELAREKNVTAIVDMGVAPGMSHVLAGCAMREMDEMYSLRILVGGLPKERIHPFEYKAGFSPLDVMEEYTRPARLVENGRIVFKEALSEVERVDFGGIGTLEAFNSDGLRSLLKTITANQMEEKTLRYPGHAALMKIFRDTGFFDNGLMSFREGKVSPRELSSALLFKHWEMMEGDEDFTIMKVMAEGKKEHRRVIFAASLYDEYNMDTGIHSMARTTAYAATAALRLVLSGQYTAKGISTPEYFGKKESWAQFLINDQAAKGIQYDITFEREEDWSSGECGSY